MMTELQPRAIVCGIDDVGVVGQLEVVQRPEQTTDLGVDVLDGVDIGVLGVWIADLIRNIKWNVRHGVRYVDEEGLVLVCLDEIDRLLGTAPRDGALVHRQLDDFLVLEQGRLPLGEGRLGIVPQNIHALPTASRLPPVVWVIHVIRVRYAVVGVEPIGSGQHLLMVTEVPLAETGGGVALSFQVIGDGVFLRIETLGGGREQNMLVHADSLGIATREQGGPGWRANRGGHHETGELPAFLGDAVDVRGIDGLGTEAAQVAVTLVVGKDYDEVRLGRLQGARDEEEKGQKKDLLFHVRCLVVGCVCFIELGKD